MASLSPIPVNGDTIIISDYSDRISMLPDHILSHILSFLPTNHAVSTSVLSKRWQFVWTYVSNISFDDKLFNRNYTDMVHKCMYKVLNELQVKRIRTFSFKNNIGYFLGFNNLDFEEWMRDAIKLKVEQLELSLSYNIPTLPKVLFTAATTLVELKLSGRIVFPKPLAVCFPNLKRLYLVSLEWNDEWNDEVVRKLISGCLVMEELYVKNSWWLVCSISSSSLTHLTLIISPCKTRYYVNVNKAKKLELNVPNLHYIHIRYNECKEFSVTGRLSSLIEAKIDLCNVHVPEKNWWRDIFQGSLKHFNNVKTLTIPSSMLKALKFAPVDTFATFQNITHLKMKAELCNWKLLSYILENSTNLQVLAFTKGYNSWKKNEERVWNQPRRVPQCVASSIRLISIHGYQGLNDESQMVRYLLKNAQVLERMSIRVVSEVNVSDIQMLHRASMKCDIVFLS